MYHIPVALHAYLYCVFYEGLLAQEERPREVVKSNFQDDHCYDFSGLMHILFIMAEVSTFYSSLIGKLN